MGYSHERIDALDSPDGCPWYSSEATYRRERIDSLRVHQRSSGLHVKSLSNQLSCRDRFEGA